MKNQSEYQPVCNCRVVLQHRVFHTDLWCWLICVSWLGHTTMF
ncbi:hypothetical protein SAMN04490194_0733 [Pseudomonas migulae]|uniref:Uncharacterized protein n=1 Tax=Pseudomonas migulae TaxID=78543 RepID=A0A1H5FEJ2_9PSED|nr:hypothetical protein SAMN04490194_0733 [Pseudomonas migulae]